MDFEAGTSECLPIGNLMAFISETVKVCASNVSGKGLICFIVGVLMFRFKADGFRDLPTGG